MALVFTVGSPKDVFNDDFANRVSNTFQSHFGNAFEGQKTTGPYYSDELGWSGWNSLQKRAIAVLGESAVEHFNSMDAWQGVYVPTNTEIGAFTFDDVKSPLNVAALGELINELEAFGKAESLPIDDKGLQEFAQKYLDDDDLIDQDMDLQTYAQLLLAAHEAKRRKQPLWVVK